MLEVETISDGRSRVRVHADAVLYYEPPRHNSLSRYGSYSSATEPARDIYAMSLIGPEQAIRAIAAGSSLEFKHQRTKLAFRGKNATVKGIWEGAWWCRAVRLTEGVVHLVAIPKVTTATDIAGEKERNHVIIPPVAGIDALKRAVYHRLMQCYTTPLMPIDLPGQPESEANAAKVWIDAIWDKVNEKPPHGYMVAPYRPLSSHPDQPDRQWAHAGLLSLSQEALDSIVSNLVEQRRLPIPDVAA